MGLTWFPFQEEKKKTRGELIISFYHGKSDRSSDGIEFRRCRAGLYCKNAEIRKGKGLFGMRRWQWEINLTWLKEFLVRDKRHTSSHGHGLGHSELHRIQLGLLEIMCLAWIGCFSSWIPPSTWITLLLLDDAPFMLSDLPPPLDLLRLMFWEAAQTPIFRFRFRCFVNKLDKRVRFVILGDSWNGYWGKWWMSLCFFFGWVF